MKYIFPSVFWRSLLVGRQKGRWPVKSWVSVCWCWRFDWNFAPVVTTTSVILAPTKSTIVVFWNWLTRVFLQNSVADFAGITLVQCHSVLTPLLGHSASFKQAPEVSTGIRSHPRWLGVLASEREGLATLPQGTSRSLY